MSFSPTRQWNAWSPAHSSLARKSNYQRPCSRQHSIAAYSALRLFSSATLRRDTLRYGTTIEHSHPRLHDREKLSQDKFVLRTRTLCSGNSLILYATTARTSQFESEERGLY